MVRFSSKQIKPHGTYSFEKLWKLIFNTNLIHYFPQNSTIYDYLENKMFHNFQINNPNAMNKSFLRRHKYTREK